MCKGKWYGVNNNTNNEAECQALVDMLSELYTNSYLDDVSELMVLGDSRLVIDFATRRARPGKASLFLKVREIQSLIK
jgi:ribonuclease HI